MPDETSFSDICRLAEGDRGENGGDDDLAQKPSEQMEQSRKCIVLPEIPAFLYYAALFGLIPVLQFWLIDYFSKEYHLVQGNETDVCSNNSQLSNSTDDLESTVQSKTTKYLMYINFMQNLFAIIPAVFIGPLTDRFGRKFVCYVSLMGLFLFLLLDIFIFRFNLHPNFLFIPAFFLGLSGSYGLFLASAFGMVVDITSAGKHRALRMATLEAAMAIGHSVGTITSGIWVKEVGYVWPVAISIGAVVFAIVYVFFLIPETYVCHHRRPLSCRIVLKSFEFYVKDTANKRRFRLIACLICILILLAAFVGEGTFDVLFLLHQPFCWSKTNITLFNGVVNLLSWISVLGFIFVGKRFISEPVFALIGTVSVVSRFVLRGLAKSNVLIFIAAAPSLLTGLVFPMCRTMMSKDVSPHEQGALFTGIGILQMIMAAVGGVIFSLIYRVGLNVYLGLPYFVLAGFVSINLFFLIALIIRRRRYPAPEQQDDADA